MECELSTFFATVFPDLEGLYLQVWTLPDKISRRYTEVTDAVLSEIDTLSQTQNVYVGCGLSEHDLGAHSRGKAEHIKAIPGLWLDVDFGTSHKKQGLPPTEAEALALIDKMGLPPTVVVYTGGGFHCWWVFKELWTFDSDEERAKAAALEKAWNDTFRYHSKQAGYTCDSVHDLTRVLRPAGTNNHKGGTRRCQLRTNADATKYNPETDFEEFLVDWVEPAKELPLPTTVFEFTLDPEAVPPALKFATLLENEPKFKQSWDHTGKLPSQSEYDLSLATYCHMAMWTPQEIVDTLVANRRVHQGDMKLRHDYYLQTIRKATQNTVVIERDALVQQFRETGIIPDEIADDHAEVLKILSGDVGIPITEIVNYPGDNGYYKIVINGSRVDWGPIDNIYEQNRFWKRLADTKWIHGQQVPSKNLSTARWRDFHNRLLGCQVIVDIHEGSSTKNQINYMLSQYLNGTGLGEEYDAEMAVTAALSGKPLRQNGAIYLSSMSFQTFCAAQHTEKWSIRQITTTLYELGYRQEERTFRSADKERRGTTKGVLHRNLWTKEIREH